MRKIFWLLALTIPTSLPAAAQGIQISKDNKTIAISTSDEASALADTAVLSIGVQLFGKDPDTAYRDAAQTSNAIITALTGAGVPKDAIESTDQGLHPLAPDNDADRARYAGGAPVHLLAGLAPYASRHAGGQSPPGRHRRRCQQQRRYRLAA